MGPASSEGDTQSDGTRRQNLTQILHAVTAGEPASMDRLMDAVYADLRRVCANELARTAPHGGELLVQPTDLVHDVYLRLVDQTRTNWENRAHFFSIAAMIVRRVLVDQVRSAQRLKRGGPGVAGRADGGSMPAVRSPRSPADSDLPSAESDQRRAISARHRVPLTATICVDDKSRLDLIELEDALVRLGRLDPESARIVEMRFFADLPEDAIGHVLRMSGRTVRRRLNFARAWLFRDIRGRTADDDGG